MAVVLVFFVVLGCVSVVRAYAKQRQAVNNRNNSIHELRDLEQKEADLSLKIDNLSTNRGMEAEVRNRYRVTKPGEQLVIVVDNNDSGETVPQGPSFWQKVRQFVGL